MLCVPANLSKLKLVTRMFKKWDFGQKIETLHEDKLMTLKPNCTKIVTHVLYT